MLHGSPGYETVEVISRIVPRNDGNVEVEFETGCFTVMSPENLDTFALEESVSYTRACSNALESMVYINHDS